MFDFVGREKWNAWKAVDALDKEEAMRKYVELLESLNVGWDVNWEAGADEVKNKVLEFKCDYFSIRITYRLV